MDYERVWKTLFQSFDEIQEVPKALSSLKYYYVGGMPEAVQCFVDTDDYYEVRKIQNGLLKYYEEDFSKHAPRDVVPRIQMVWNSIPGQLAKENRKFIYGMIREGARAKEFEKGISLQKCCWKEIVFLKSLREH